ncbi:hypothetical protein NUW58_g3174 [Xylaria curta]|uniref:Uncharacterized protein n=2 Tax=Xylaria curta TaxID=42375 RepID=A0ACC1P4W2_9PEZI|nr:hypothetical protein NUW58_g4821 [Xylaria curta]KAJ2989995.1 hypothetical protein NUW58_g3174 [Xylaria curta]
MSMPPMGVGDDPTIDPKYREENSLAMQLSVVTAIHIIALTIALLRVYSRIFLAKAFGWDDGLMVGAVLSALVSWILYIYEAQHGLGMHRVFVSKEDLWVFGASNFAQTIINLLVFVTIYTIFAFLTLFLYCQPLSGFWDITSGAKCYSLELFIRFGLANTALSIFTDILLASLPIPVIWQLQLKTKLRVYLIIMLALGWGAVGIGIVKAINQINYNPFGDSTFNVGVPTWAFIQLNVSIIAACAPQLKKLLRPLLKLTSSYKTSAYGQPSTNKRNATGQSIGGRYTRQRSQADKTDAFELDERPIISPDRYHVKIQHGNESGGLGTRAVASSQLDKMTHRSDSSDSLFREGNSNSHNGKGIMRTTEVVISTA